MSNIGDNDALRLIALGEKVDEEYKLDLDLLSAQLVATSSAKTKRTGACSPRAPESVYGRLVVALK